MVLWQLQANEQQEANTQSGLELEKKRFFRLFSQIVDTSSTLEWVCRSPSKLKLRSDFVKSVNKGCLGKQVQGKYEAS